jgi:hypothetical protein
MKRLLFLALIFVLVQAALADTQKLSQAYEQQLIERVKNVFSRETAVKIERPTCATSIFLEARANWDRLSLSSKKILQPYLSRPTFSVADDTFDTPEGNFRIHYVIEGDDAVKNPLVDNNYNGCPDWVDTVGMVLEHVRRVGLEDLEFAPPPSDSENPDTADIGGDGRYDVYLLNITAQGYLGYTDGEYFVAPPSGRATSYIVLDNDYLGYGTLHTGIEWLQVTAAHEFFHAIQMGYDGAEYEQDATNIKPYWMELSAVWMEEMVYDHINDYLEYLSSFFNYPWLSLKTFASMSDLHAYGSCVWAFYLTEKFDTLIVKDIWEECARVAGPNVLTPVGESATDVILAQRGSSFEEAFKEFTVWNYFTGPRAITNRTNDFFSYSEGDLFPQVWIQHTHPPPDYPVNNPSGPNHPYGLGSNYIEFEPEELEGGVHLEFTPAGGGDFQTSIVGYNQNALEPIFPKVTVNHQTGAAECDFYNWTSFNKIVMIAAAADRNDKTLFPFSYSAEYDSSLHGEEPFPQEVWIGQNFPNPFVIDDPYDLTYFPFIFSSVSTLEIKIFAVSGELVWQYPPPGKEGQEWVIGEYTERGECPAWDGKNQNDEYVASGVYVYQVKTKNSTEVKKMAVIR